MSPITLNRTPVQWGHYAAAFAALSDPTRLWLVAKLCSGEALSITNLAEGSDLTRQAVTKHLQVLERAGMVHSARDGRESRYELEAGAFENMKEYLEYVSQQWDSALSRLKSFVER